MCPSRKGKSGQPSSLRKVLTDTGRKSKTGAPSSSSEASEDETRGKKRLRDSDIVEQGEKRGKQDDVIAFTPSPKDKQTGYVWHQPALPGQSLVGVRKEENQDGRIIRMNVGGRPKNKHGSSQGQHTTAYGANREVVLAATLGRTETEARKEMAFLFKMLLSYPAFSNSDRPVPPTTGELVKSLANAGSRKSKSYDLEELAQLYLEIRDALPGSSLDTGITGKASNSSRANITGKGEGTTLSQLRQAEEAALGDDMEEDEAAFNHTEAVANLLKLYDTSSETAAGLDLPQRLEQRATFLMSVAQGFPAVFQQVGGLVVQTLAKDFPDQADKTRLQEYKVIAQQAAEHLAQGNKGKKRPAPSNFVADIGVDNRISFVGRAKSPKDGDTMGDHTVCEQLMKDAATHLLMADDGFPSLEQLATRLETIAKTFALEKYDYCQDDDRFQDPTQPVYAITTARYLTLAQQHELLNELISRIREMAPDEEEEEEDEHEQALADPGLVAEAAEIYMALVDSRPTAVHSSSPAGSRGEPAALKTLRSVERGEANLKDKELFDKALELFDHNSASRAVEDLNAFDENAADQYLKQVVREFLFFLKHGYPSVYGQLRDGFGKKKLVQEIKTKIGSEGDLDRDDDEYEEQDFDVDD